MSEPSTLSEIGTWIQIIANICVVGGALFAVYQYRETAKVAQIERVQGFIDTITQLTDKLSAADTNEDKQNISIAYFNHVELLAFVVNNKMLREPSYTFIYETVYHYIKSIGDVEYLNDLFKNNYDDHTTYGEIKKFAIAKDLQAVVALYQGRNT